MAEPHVLVVAAEAGDATRMAAALRRVGFRVSVADDDPTATRLLRHHPEQVHAVVCHPSRIGAASGSELADALRAVRRSRATPVVLVTGLRALYDVYCDRGEGLLECDALLVKPFHHHRLAATVAAALSGPPPQTAGLPTTKGELVQ